MSDAFKQFMLKQYEEAEEWACGVSGQTEDIAKEAWEAREPEIESLRVQVNVLTRLLDEAQESNVKWQAQIAKLTAERDAELAHIYQLENPETGDLPTALAKLADCEKELSWAYKTVDANWVSHKQLTAAESRIAELETVLHRILEHIPTVVTTRIATHYLSRKSNLYALMEYRDGVIEECAKLVDFHIDPCNAWITGSTIRALKKGKV